MLRIHALITNRVDYTATAYCTVSLHLAVHSLTPIWVSNQCGCTPYNRQTKIWWHHSHLRLLQERQRIQYKLCTLVSKCLRLIALSYLADAHCSIRNNCVVVITLFCRSSSFDTAAHCMGASRGGPSGLRAHLEFRNPWKITNHNGFMTLVAYLTINKQV